MKLHLDGTLKCTAAHTPGRWTHDCTAGRLTSITCRTVPDTTLDERTGSSGWTSLGTRSYAEGTGAAVSLTASGTGCVHADAVKPVRR
ncbi:hypothetical protein AADR41_24665 [Streptomyces sp. CLV115]|uniref:hypothetical protein n=1 Tax=Streptomyces sp. CLV115 TaxID=3138502 RepID=UPI00313ABF35